jgi:hypothetical protein
MKFFVFLTLFSMSLIANPGRAENVSDWETFLAWNPYGLDGDKIADLQALDKCAPFRAQLSDTLSQLDDWIQAYVQFDKATVAFRQSCENINPVSGPTHTPAQLQAYQSQEARYSQASSNLQSQLISLGSAIDNTPTALGKGGSVSMRNGCANEMTAKWNYVQQQYTLIGSNADSLTGDCMHDLQTSSPDSPMIMDSSVPAVN